MHYVEAGTGRPIVFLHGFPEFWYSWRHQLAAFAPTHRVVAPDLRGYNETEKRGPYDTDTLQEDVLSLIDRVGGPVHLVAHDWGGAIGWLVAMNHPGKLLSYTACNIPHPALFQRAMLRNPRQLARSWYMGFFQLPWLPQRALAFRNYQALARGIINDCRPGTFTREDIKLYLEAWRRQGLDGGINWYRALVRHPRRGPNPVPPVTVPTLMVWGEDDVALGKELTHGTEELVPELAIHYLPNTGHWVQQEQPERVNELLAQHFAMVEARG